MKSTRGAFLAAGVALTAVPQIAAASPSPSPPPSPNPEPSFPPLSFNTAAFDAVLNVPASHKHLFTAAMINGGFVLGATRNTLVAYKDIGVSLNDVQPAVVLYHATSFLGYNDAIWNDYVIPIQRKSSKSLTTFAKDVNTVYDNKSSGNPCLHKTGKGDDSSIESLIADANARFFVCNNATKGIATYIGKQLNLDPLGVYAKLKANLVPNAMLVPAGVWAIHSVQEHHYTYLQATL